MSDTPGESGGRPSWRDAPSGGEWRRPEGVRSWRRPEHDGEDGDRPSGFARTPWRKVFKSLAAVMMTAACIVVTVTLWSLISCVETQLQPIMAEIDDTLQLPPNLRAAADADRDALNSLNLTSIRKDRVLVVYLSAFWVPDANGDVLVITSNKAKLDSLSDSKRSSSKLPDGFEKLADYLSGPIQSASQKNTLVLLDLCQMQTNWRIGVLENDIEEQIKEAVRTHANPAGEANLAVICSCSRGERSWASPDLGNGQTAFGFYACEALAGEADKNGGVVTISKFFLYVGSETNRWVQQNRDRNGQHPILITGDKAFVIPGKGKDRDFVNQLEASGVKDFDVVAAEPKPKQHEKPGKDTASQFAELKKLKELWTARNNLVPYSERVVEHPYHQQPLQWRELTFRLRRAEQWIFWNRLVKARKQRREASDLLARLEQGSEVFAGVEEPFARDNIIARLKDNLQTAEPPRLPENERSVALPEQRLRQELNDTRTMRPEATAELEERAIKNRLQAERATSGAFGTYHRVQSILKDADHARREAEDLLFVGDIKATQSSMDKAEVLLARATDIRRTLFKALLSRNRLHAELPQLAHWAASRNPSRRVGYQEVIALIGLHHQLPSEKRAEQLKKRGRQDKPDVKGAAVHFRLLALFEQAQLLDTHLAVSPGSSDASPGEPAPDDLKCLLRLADDAWANLNTLHGELEAEAKGCLKHLNQPEHWRDIQDVLRHTGLPADTRRELLKKLIEMSGKLQPGSEPVVTQQTSPVDLGVWQAMWAIKIVSLGRISDEPADGPSIADLWTSWRTARARTDKERPLALRKLGHEISRASIAKRQAVVDDPAVAGEKQSDVAAVRTKLQQADRIARSLPPFDAFDLRVRQQQDPTRELRKFQLSELLYAHARRYLDDFWEGWFDAAAGECLDAARSLGVQVFNQRRDDLETLRTKRIKLAEQFSTGTLLKTTSPIPLRFGIPDSATVGIAFTSTPDFPPGLASLRLKLTPTDKGLLTLEDPSAHRLKIEPPKAGTTTTTTTTGEFTLQRNASLKLAAGSLQTGCPGLTFMATPRVFYRGHETNDESLEFSIHPCPPPVFVVEHVPLTKTTGQVSVKGTNKRQAIMFILDCSFSMSYPNETNKRWNAAIKGLTEVLNRLYSPTSHTTLDIGLMAFGHRWDGNTAQTLYLERYKRKIPTKVKDANGYLKDIELLTEFHPLGQAHRDKTLEYFKYLKPWGGTPSFAALNEAVGHFEKRDSGGLVVLLTDGIDEDTTYKMHVSKLQTSLQKNPGVSLQVVLFGPTLETLAKDPSLTNKHADLGDRIKALRDILNKDMGHELHEAAEVKELAIELAAAVAPRPYFIRDSETMRQLGPYHFSSKSSLRGHDVERGHHFIRYGSIDSDTFEIQGGEHHVFKLQGGTQFLYQQPEAREALRSPNGLFAEASNEMKLICSDYCLVPGKTLDKAPRTTDKTARRSAEFILCLVGKEPHDIVSRPRKILFDIVPTPEFGKRPGEQRSRTTRWEVVPERTAPTWKVTVDDWPPSKTATIRAYWDWKLKPTDRAGRDENNLRVWSQVQGEHGAQVFVPLSEVTKPKDNKGEHNIDLKGTYHPGVTNGNTRTAHTIKILIKPTDKSTGEDEDKSTELDSDFHEHFGRLLPELVWKNGTNLPDLEYSSRFTCEPGSEKLIYTFVLPADLEFDLKELQVRVLSWTDRKASAVQLLKPLVTKPLDPERRSRFRRPDDR